VPISESAPFVPLVYILCSIRTLADQAGKVKLKALPSVTLKVEDLGTTLSGVDAVLVSLAPPVNTMDTPWLWTRDPLRLTDTV